MKIKKFYIDYLFTEFRPTEYFNIDFATQLVIMAFYLEINSPRNKRVTSHHPYATSPMGHSVFTSSHAQQDLAYRSSLPSMPPTDSQSIGLEGYMNWMACRGNTNSEVDTSWESSDYHLTRRISSNISKSDLEHKQINGILRPPRHQRERTLAKKVTWRDDAERSKNISCVPHPCCGKSALVDVYGESNSICVTRANIPSRTIDSSFDPILSFRGNKQSTYPTKRSLSPLHVANEGWPTYEHSPFSIRRSASPHPMKILSRNCDVYDSIGFQTSNYLPQHIIANECMELTTKSRRSQHYSPSPRRETRNLSSVPGKISIRTETPLRQEFETKPRVESYEPASSITRNSATINHGKVNFPISGEQSLAEVSRDVVSPVRKTSNLKNASHQPNKELHYAEIIWKSKEPNSETPLEEKKRGWNLLRRSGSAGSQRSRAESPDFRRRNSVSNQNLIVSHDEDKDWC
jgi:hypothetical protein